MYENKFLKISCLVKNQIAHMCFHCHVRGLSTRGEWGLGGRKEWGWSAMARPNGTLLISLYNDFVSSRISYLPCRKEMPT